MSICLLFLLWVLLLIVVFDVVGFLVRGVNIFVAVFWWEGWNSLFLWWGWWWIFCCQSNTSSYLPWRQTDRQTPGINTEGFIIIFQTLSSTMCWHFHSNLNIALRDEEFTHHLVSILEIPWRLHHNSSGPLIVQTRSRGESHKVLSAVE